MLLVFYFTKAELCILRSNWILIIAFGRVKIQKKEFVDRIGNMYGANRDLNRGAIRGTGMPYKTFLSTRSFVC